MNGKKNTHQGEWWVMRVIGSRIDQKPSCDLSVLDEVNSLEPVIHNQLEASPGGVVQSVIDKVEVHLGQIVD